MISKQTAEHFTWREVCDGWYLVNQPTRLTVLQESIYASWHQRGAALSPGSAPVLFHSFWRRHIGNQWEIRDSLPQEGLEVPPLTPHQMLNRSYAPMEFLVISQPNSRDNRVFVTEPSDKEE